MKHLLLIFTLFLSVVASNAVASNADLFSMNEEQVSASLSQSTEIENYVVAHDNATLTSLQTESQSNLNLKNVVANFNSFTIDNINWTAFAWGFCCWPIGVFTVLLDDGASSDDKISYLIGAGIAFIGWGGFWRVSVYNAWFWY